MLPEGPTGANWLRYERMHELAFHRAYAAFLKGRKEAAAASDEAASGAEHDRHKSKHMTNNCITKPPSESEVSPHPVRLADSMAPNEAIASGGSSPTQFPSPINVARPARIPSPRPSHPAPVRGLAGGSDAATASAGSPGASDA